MWAARIPVRTNDDDRYFGDTFQFMPEQGYSALFQRMLASPNIDIQLSTDYADIRENISYDLLIYTGPIDAFFDFRFGKLPYRSLRFEHEHFANTAEYQITGTINYPNDYAYTRISEFKYLTGQNHTGTSIVREYPQADGDPYYPIPQIENEQRYQQYKKLAAQCDKVAFVGRLAQYRYYNMDQVVGAALTCAEDILQN